MRLILISRPSGNQDLGAGGQRGSLEAREVRAGKGSGWYAGRARPKGSLSKREERFVASRVLDTVEAWEQV